MTRQRWFSLRPTGGKLPARVVLAALGLVGLVSFMVGEPSLSGTQALVAGAMGVIAIVALTLIFRRFPIGSARPKGLGAGLAIGALSVLVPQAIGDGPDGLRLAAFCAGVTVGGAIWPPVSPGSQTNPSNRRSPPLDQPRVSQPRSNDTRIEGTDQ